MDITLETIHDDLTELINLNTQLINYVKAYSLVFGVIVGLIIVLIIAKGWTKNE